jgi:hypothetical protein
MPPRVHEENMAAWNQAAPYYRARAERSLEALRAGRVLLHPIERRLLGEPDGSVDLAVHLQCSAGVEAISLWNAGARRVAGIDGAGDLLAIAGWLGRELGAPARWFCRDVIDPPAELHRCADVVYTGQGSVLWVHDLEAWAEAVRFLLAPGGRLVLYDLHAMSALFDADSDVLRATARSYFAPRLRFRQWPGSYVGDALEDGTDVSERTARLWPPSAVVQALIDAGLRIEAFGEYPDAYWDAFPRLDPTDRRRVACTFSVVARRP